MTALASISPVVVLTNHMVIGGAEVWVATVSHWLAERGLQVIVAASPGELVDRLHPNVRYHAIPLTDVRFSLPIAVLRVRRLLREYRPRVIIANSLATTWVARLATLSERVPIVEVAHGWPHPRYRWAAPLARVASLVVPVSADVAGRLREGGAGCARQPALGWCRHLH